MKSSITTGKSSLHFIRLLKNRIACPLFILIFCLHVSELKSQNCNACCLPSFPALTVYQTFQTGHGMGFGIEAGNWQKDVGKFSYFIGTSMVWGDNINSNIKTKTSENQMLLSFYFKGQYKLTKHLYVVAAPGIVNLSFFDLQAGLRYVIPVSRVIGIGVEPAYSFNQKVMVVNANLHFALR